MARPARPWFRMYVETVYDLKLRRQPPDVRWVWVAVLASARQSPLPGTLLVSERIPMTLDDLAEVAAVDTETVNKAVDAFIEADMLHRDDESRMAVVNWASRQFESDNRAGTGADAPQTKGGSSGVPPPKRGSSVNGTTTEPTTPESESESEENPSVDTVDDGFDAFWSRYPARDGKKAGKAKAVSAWKRMSKAKRDLALTGVEHYAASGWRAKDAFRWLNDEAWVDWQEPATPDKQEPKEQAVY